MIFNAYAFPPLVSSIFFCALAIFVLSRHNRTALNTTLGLACFVTAWWQLSWFFLFSTVDQNFAQIIVKIGYSGIIFIPLTLYHFFVGFANSKRDQKLVISGYLFCLLMFCLLWGSNYVINGYYNFFWGHYPKAGILHPLFLVVLVSLAIRTAFLLAHNLKTSPSSNRNQSRFVFFAFLAYLPASLDFLVNYGIEFYPPGFVFILVTLGLLTYAIMRYRLLDIEVIIRKTLVFAGLFSFAFGVFAFVTFLTQEFFSAYVHGTTGKILSLFVSVFLIVLGYEPLKQFLINLTDRFLFQKKYDYRKLLRDASAGISQIKSLNQLLSLVTHFVTMRIRVKSAAILMHDQKNNYFKFAYSRGYSQTGRLKQGHIFNTNDPLIGYLNDERTPLDIERVKEWAEQNPKSEISATKLGRFAAKFGERNPKSKKAARYDFQAIKMRMEELQAACCVPSYLGERLRNVLILGEKRSGDFYSDEDLNVLYTLAQESAIAIENARLYDQAIEKAKELAVINEQLNTAQSNLLRALDETEVANKKLRDTHVQLIHEQKMATLGRLASSVGHEVNNPLTILSMNVSRAILKHRSNPDLKVRDVLDIFQKMEQNISRIKAVVNTLTGLLKKSEHGKFEALSLKLVLEETLPLVQFQTYLENLSGTEVTFDVPNGLPLIKGDLERLQEVFLNLFINAYHAMADRRDRKIIVTAHESPAHPAMMLIEFSDNGAGMTDEVMKKAFSYGFTTKPTGKGSGMGLYMCRYIIELHGGEVKVRSKLGEGTTFAITLPIYYEPTSAISSDESAGQ